MADPFEIRMRFTTQLRGLNASVTSAQKAAQFALKHREVAEDLHSCILEQLESDLSDLNKRAKIMFFLEQLCDMARKDGHADYIRMIQRDIIRIVDAVAPEDGSGAANILPARLVVESMQVKKHLESEIAKQILEVLKDRQTTHIESTLPPDSNDDPNMAPSQCLPKKGQGAARPDRKVVEQRIEEDRERHKRLRENIWAIPTGDYSELDKLLEEISDFGDDDLRIIEEEEEEWRQSQQRICSHKVGPNGQQSSSK
ncbi:hypothetical protein OQA88_201 [Cercophora sp. LCS_1]